MIHVKSLEILTRDPILVKYESLSVVEITRLEKIRCPAHHLWNIADMSCLWESVNCKKTN